MSTSSSALSASFQRRPWIYSFLGAIVIWLMTLALSGGSGAIQSLQAAMDFAMFFVMGPAGNARHRFGAGRFDLSMPSV